MNSIYVKIAKAYYGAAARASSHKELEDAIQLASALLNKDYNFGLAKQVRHLSHFCHHQPSIAFRRRYLSLPYTAASSV
jgi:hypothetical protein